MSQLPHDSAHTHVRGESEFIDDRRPAVDEVFLGIVFSSQARAKIKKLDLAETKAHPGVVAVFTAKDFAHNRWGTIFQDQPLLAEDEVFYEGEAIAIVAAESREAAREGVRLAKVTYGPLASILSITEAKKANSFIGSSRKIERGDVERALRSAKHRIEGTVVIHGQDHFYLESQAALAYPKEDGQVEVHSSSQHPTEAQHVVAHGLGLASKDVVCVVTRMGGGFGGKESQGAPIAAYAALAAVKLKRPARLILSKDDDMVMTGKRNPFENDYTIGFDDEGRIVAADLRLFSDGGAYADLSTAIMERAMLHSDNAYFLPSVRITGQVCRTHYHPHTAFRGFGGPKGVATIERIIEEIAHFLKKDPLEIRKRNCYSSMYNVTPYGQTLDDNRLPELFERLEKECDYLGRREAITLHNQSMPRKIRGLSMTAVKFGISFTTRFLNQGNSLVVIHRDGSVQVSTGATEMGQGVNARIAQVVAEELGIPRGQVRVMPTSTDKNANTSPTAASSGTDLNASAAVLATRKIKSRLSELASALLKKSKDRWAKETAALGTESEIEVQNSFRATLPNEEADFESGIATFSGIVFEKGAVRSEKGAEQISFEDLVNEAYLNRISLSDYAHYRVPGLSFNKLTGQGKAFLYFTQGVAASEVSVDTLTGEVKVERVDILMDLGRPINEPLDMGQVWGGFIQGMGWVTTENLFYTQDGRCLSHSPSTYKIPSVQDIPRNFSAKLLPNDRNKENIRGTKAVGEPPLLLCVSVWTAIQDALRQLPRYETSYPRLAIPATSEAVLRAVSPEKFSRWEKDEGRTRKTTRPA